MNMASLRLMLIPLVLVVTCFNDASAVTADDMRTHLDAILTNYDTRVRPITDQSQAVDVTVDMFLIGINNFDNSEQKLETTAILNVVWKDEVLTAASKWSNAAISEVLLNQGSIWLPDLALQNGFTSLSGMGSSDLNVKITKATQEVVWTPYQVFESSCAVDVTYFPFDKTTCDLKFVIWSNPVSLVKAVKGSHGINLTSYETNSEWDLLSVTATNFETTTTSGVTFSLELKRKPLYYLLNIMIPVIMLAILNGFVFVLPASSGERTGLAVTAFLAFAVFLTIISAELPQNSEKISTFAAYLFIMTFISTLITLITIAELRLFSRGPSVPIPSYLQSITRCVRSIRCGACCEGKDGYILGLKRQLADDINWEDAVDNLDFVLFWMFFLIIILVTILCIAIAATSALD